MNSDLLIRDKARAVELLQALLTNKDPARINVTVTIPAPKPASKQ